MQKLTAVVAAAVALSVAAASSAQDFSLPAEPGLEDGPASEARDTDDPRVSRCRIELVHDVEVPAGEAGVLTYLGVKQGDPVKAEELIAQIDDREVRQGFRVAQFAKRAADARAENDVEIIYNKAASLVAREEWIEMEQANKRVDKSVTDSERRKAKLEYDRSQLAIENAEKDKMLAGLDADTKHAELEAARIAVDKRRVLSPYDGMVLEVLRDEHEWVQPGEPIVRIAQLDQLQVDGYLYFDEYDPREIVGCEVTVEVIAGRGRKHEATGRIVHIAPRAEYDGRYRYRVRAEIANRQMDGRWLIQPKLPATMTIHLGTGGNATVGDRRSARRTLR